MTDEQHEGKTENGQPQEPGLKGEGSVALNRIVADLARVAHWLLSDGGITKRSAASDLADLVRKLNALSPTPWGNADLARLLGNATTKFPGRVPVPAVDRSRSYPNASAVAEGNLTREIL